MTVEELRVALGFWLGYYDCGTTKMLDEWPRKVRKEKDINAFRDTTWMSRRREVRW
jgi:hypothetical protein